METKNKKTDAETKPADKETGKGTGTKRILKRIKNPLNELKRTLKNRSESEFPLAMVEECLIRYRNEEDKKEKRQWLKLVAEFFHHVHRCEGGTDAESLADMEDAIEKMKSGERVAEDLGEL